MSEPRKKGRIQGQSRSLHRDEADEIRDMILDAQRSSRRLTIPAEDLDPRATTKMRPEVENVVRQSRVQELLEFFNRNYLFGMGRFDEYSEGMLLKWGDGYSRKHIWVTAHDNMLDFEVSHERPCVNPYCTNGHHIYPEDQWRDLDVLNLELAEQFRFPVYERSDD
jgi:hypothetical protein